MKTIPIALQSHLDEDATTTCLLCRVETKGGTVYGFTSLDADVVYDDGDGSVTYRADNGFTPERLQASADLSVDNTDLQGWVSDTGITEAQIRAGLFDYARVRVYRVNYLDLTDGHEVVAVGTCGETQFGQNGWKTEFRSLVQQLKQPQTKLYSLTCDKVFGSKPIGTGGEQPEAKYPCGVDWVWVSAVVTGVDPSEPDRIFTASGLTQDDGHFDPGVVKVTSGPNAGIEMEVDSFVGGVVTLALPLPYPMSEDDEFDIRQDCNKVGRLGDCKLKHNNYVNFGGQEDIPIADAGSALIPGARIS